MADEMQDIYFSEREGQFANIESAQIGGNFWGGFISVVNQRIGSGAFAQDFPIRCTDTSLPYDTDLEDIALRLSAEIQSVEWPLNSRILPTTHNALDSTEFFWRHVSEVTARSEHTSTSWGFQHHHFVNFDRAIGRESYRSDINRLLRRCAHPYFMDEHGKIRRRIATTIQGYLQTAHFRTGDLELDRLLTEACERFESPIVSMQRESLERLWDAWERLKSVLAPGPGNKLQSTKKLLDEFVVEPELRKAVEADARALTDLGNNLMIRHTETTKPIIAKSEHVDYLFVRLYALISAILKSRGWMTTT